MKRRKRERAGEGGREGPGLPSFPMLLTTAVAAAQQRPMTFLDVQHLRNAGRAAISPDGKQVLYTLSTPDWKEARRSTDIFLVAVAGGSARPGR